MLPEQPEWADIIRALNAKGVSCVEIADVVGITRQRIDRIKNQGGQCSYRVGAKLLNLHQKRTADERTD